MSKQPDVYHNDDSESDSRDLARQAQIELPYGTIAFRKLVERYSGRVFRRAVGLVGSMQDAEEVTQDVFLRVFRSIKRYRAEQSFERWLLAIATNSARNLLRRRYREIRKHSEYADSLGAPNLTFDVADAVGISDLERALATLDSTTRLAISLRFLEDQTYSEIAIQLNMKQSAVKMRVHRGIEQLRRYLAKDV